MTVKVTPWFPGDVKPKYVGVYERNYGDCRAVYTEWNGKEWGRGFYYAYEIQRPFRRGPNQNMMWRGLAKKP